MRNDVDPRDIKRIEPGYRRKAERLRDYRAVEQQLPMEEIREQGLRCMGCGTPFCHAYGCPLMNVIPEWNALVADNRWKEALDLMLTTNPFPEFTGRICPALCEGSCVLGIHDDPVTIRQIELMIAERGFEEGWMEDRAPKTRRPERVAIIGSGPAGLSAADYLNKAGFSVIVFDRAAQPGGILRYGIPSFKLEKPIVDRRIKLMEAEGVRFENGVDVGVDLSYHYLRDRFDAVCLCGGAREPRDLSVPGRDLEGIHFAMPFLMAQNRRDMEEPVPPEQDISARNRTVVVIGGGDTGSDCLGTSLRQGAKKVYQLEIMPKPPTDRADDNPWPLWPRVYRESSSHKEGGDRRWCVNTKEFVGKDGKLTGLKCVEVEWQPGENGRMRPVEKPGTEFDLEADLVLLSMGFTGPGRNRMVEDLNIEKDGRGNIRINEQNMTSEEGVFAAGDMSSGQSLVVRAMADGLQAAHGIMAYLEERNA